MRENFPYGLSLTDYQLLKEMKNGKFFGYVQCKLEASENLRTIYVNFSPIF